MFSDYFDTRIGAKREVGSYRRILAAIACRAEEVLFLSDIGEELDAAREAGMATTQVLRDEKAKPFPTHPAAKDFTEVQLR